MSRVLIVSKTRMRGDHVCVGGHDLDESMRSIRLLQSDGTNMPAGTRFEIGQVWDLDYEPAIDIRPPHVEDVLVNSHGARHIDTIQTLGAFLRTRITPWTGTLFERALLRTNSGTGYVPIDGPPHRAAPATGFPNSPWTSTATVVTCSAPTAGGGAAFVKSGWSRPPLGSSPKRS